jgi:UDP-glucose 4-epimerase
MTDSLTVGVTGAGGYLGARTARALLQSGHDVVPIDNGFNAAVSEVDGVQILDVDIRDRDRLTATFADVDAVCHLAAYSGLDECDNDPDGAFETNVQGTSTVGWFCRTHEIPLSFAGSVAVYGEPDSFPIRAEDARDPRNRYGWTKAVNEDDIAWLARDTIPAHVMNMANLYGRHTVGETTLTKHNVIEIFATRAANGDPLVVNEPGTQARNWVHVADVADAYVRSVECLVDDDPGASTYLLATDDVYSVVDIAEMVVAATEDHYGRTPAVTHRPNPRDEALAPDFSMDWRPLADDLSWRPEHDVEPTIREMVAA